MRRLMLSAIYMFSAILLAYGQRGELERVKALYENDMYESVQKEVVEILSGGHQDLSDDVRMELEAYRVLSSIKLAQDKVDGTVADYLSRYPHSHYKSLIKFHHSQYYFEKGEYAKCLAILKGVDIKYLGKSQRMDVMFNKAYCNMRVGDNKEAEAGFRQLLSLGATPYKASSQYYLGYLHYMTSDFQSAVKTLKELENNHEYSLLSGYFMAESYFMLKEYENAIKYGESVYEKLDGDFRLKCVRILSQSHFELDHTREAKKYLEMYSAAGETLSRKDNYYSGVVSYSLQSYYAAVDAFSKVVTQSDSLAQNAYLYLGNSYLKIKNKLSALGAFSQAAALEYDPVIQEEAYFLYAKLAFDLNSDIVPFNQYITKYPSSRRGDEIYNYIATSYLQKRDFKEAVDALGKVRNLTPEMKLNFQKAAFFRGMQLLEAGSYRSAIENFRLSARHSAYNRSLEMLARFWESEAYYRVNEYSRTMELLAPMIQNSAFKSSDEYPMALVNMGYSHYNQANYPTARGWFEEYLKLAPSRRNMTLEIKSRLADCFYMEKDYERAAEIYEEVSLKTFNKGDVYASYMGAMAYGMISQPQKKISMLSHIINDVPKGEFYYLSLYQLGRTYVQEEEHTEAIKCFNTLLQDKGDSTYYTKSLLELGMIHSNISKYGQALDYFTAIVEKYPLSPDVQSALAGIESVYQLQNRPQDYLAYLEKVGMSSVKTADEKEQMLFNGAEQLFLAGKYAEALESLGSFIAQYPDGAKAPQAYFYIAESYNKTGKYEFAADNYLKVMNTGEGAFVELATLYYGAIELQLEHFDKAASAYESLESIAQLDNNKFEAKLGKMRAYYGHKVWDKVISAGEAVLAAEQADADIIREANYKMAKSYQLQGNREAALPIFGKLSSEYSTPEGAESAYILILNAYDEGDFEKVENLVYAFSDAGTSQMYWLAKSFIVLGDSFAEREDLEQAKATFESIKEGYTPANGHDDVLEQVQMRLSKISENE